jgi:hypothetical protein
LNVADLSTVPEASLTLISVCTFHAPRRHTTYLFGQNLFVLHLAIGAQSTRGRNLLDFLMRWEKPEITA